MAEQEDLNGTGSEIPVVPDDAPTDVPQQMPATVVVTVAVGFAAMDRAIEAQRLAFRGLGTIAGGIRRSLFELERLVGWEDRPAVPSGLQEMADAGRESAREVLKNLEAVADRVVNAVVCFVLDRLDLKQIVARVDIDAVIQGMDMNALANQVIDELDLDALTNQVIDELDLRALVHRVIGELDLTAIVESTVDDMDLTALARRVMDELDLPVIIRESTGAVTVETVDALRMGGANADRALSRAIDRLLRRKSGRDLHLNGDGHAEAPPAAVEVEEVTTARVETVPVPAPADAARTGASAEPGPAAPQPAEPVPTGASSDGAPA